MMKIHVYGQNKPNERGYDANGKYYERRYGGSYSGHMIADSMEQAQKYIQEYIQRNWDVQIEIESEVN